MTHLFSERCCVVRSRLDNEPVDLFEVKPADLLNAWRDAVRAAELAERLAEHAAEALESADLRAVASSELAALARQAAEAAARAAERAELTAAEAKVLAMRLRDEGMPAAQRTVDSATALEAETREAYHEAEAQVRADSSPTS